VVRTTSPRYFDFKLNQIASFLNTEAAWYTETSESANSTARCRYTEGRRTRNIVNHQNQETYTMYCVYIPVCLVARAFSSVFPNICLLGSGVFRNIFGPKGGEVTGDWRILHNGELNDLYS
jgi:hypothetical protein